MAQSPYETLGVPRHASQEEIKKAYREMVKKYHPDQYVGTPMEAQAQEKLKEINLAYDELQKETPRIRIVSQSRPGEPSQTGTHWNGYSDAELTRVTVLIAQRQYAAAEQALIRMARRDAPWYYLRGILYSRQGWYVEARKSFEQACQMDPSNVDYRKAYDRMRGINQSYERMRVRPRDMSDTTLECCCSGCVDGCCCRVCCEDCSPCF